MSTEGTEAASSAPIINGSPSTIVKIEKPKAKLPISILLIIVVLIIIVLLVVYLIVHNSDKKNVNKIVINSNICSSKQIGFTFGQVVSSLKANDISTQASYVGKIKQQQNYQTDPNCMYIVTLYYANIFNKTMAQESLLQFDKVNSTNKLSLTLAAYLPANKLAGIVSNVVNQSKIDETNSASLSTKASQIPDGNKKK